MPCRDLNERVALSGLNNTNVVALCCHTAFFLSSLLLGWSRIGWNQQPEAVGGWWSHPERCGQRQILTQSGANHEHTCNSPGVSGDGRWTGTNNGGATAASVDAICQQHTSQPEQNVTTVVELFDHTELHRCYFFLGQRGLSFKQRGFHSLYRNTTLENTSKCIYILK